MDVIYDKFNSRKIRKVIQLKYNASKTESDKTPEIKI
jgi:hypothetical protein